MKTKETLGLVWSDFQTNVKDSFQNVRATEKFSDVTLACDGDTHLIEAHRIILATGSSFFQRVLSQETVKHPHPLLYLGGVRRTDLEAILDFLYHGQTEVPQMELLTFLQTAKTLGIKGLNSEEEYCQNQEISTGLEGGGDKDPIDGHERLNSDVKEAVLTPQQSAVWQFMDRLDYNSAQCKMCGMVRNCIAGSTTNLNNHIFKHHQKEGQTIQEQISLKKIQREEKNKFLDKVNRENKENKDFVLFNDDLPKLGPIFPPWRDPVGVDLQFQVEEFNSEELSSDQKEELSLTSNNSQIYEGSKDGKLITYNPNTVLKRYNHGLAWQFFSFKGTKEAGPDKSTVYCSLCSIAIKYYHKNSSTTNLREHLKSVHWEEFHAAKVKESYETIPNQAMFLEGSSTKNKESKNNLSDEDEEDEENREGEEDNVMTFTPALVLDKTPKSLCWNFFFFKCTEEDGPVRSRVYCNLCPMSQLYSGSTTNLKSHLRIYHQNELKQVEMSRLQRDDEISPKEAGLIKALTSDQKEIKNEVAEMVEVTEDDKVARINKVKTFNPVDVLSNTPKSLCWKFFFFRGTEEDGAVRTRVYCNLCPKEGEWKLGFLFSSSTTNLTAHLRTNHRQELNEAESSRLANQMACNKEIYELSRDLQLEASSVQENILAVESTSLKDIAHTSPVWMFMENLEGGQAKCELCGKIFGNKNTTRTKYSGIKNLREHILSGHSETKQALFLRKAIKERKAQKKIISHSSFVEDMVVSAGSKWQCKICANVLKDMTQVTKHARTHF